MGLSIFRATPKGMNRGAYRGRLTCPVCSSEAIRYVENITRFRIRYRCRKCGLKFQYDISGAPPGLDGGSHPYAPWKKNKWQRIVSHFNATREDKKGGK